MTCLLGSMADKSEFELALEALLNSHSQEQASCTPDFILAEYLRDCLCAFNAAVIAREQWYGRAIVPVGSLVRLGEATDAEVSKD